MLTYFVMFLNDFQVCIMVRTYHRKTDRGSWSAEVLNGALGALQCGAKTLDEASAEFGIPKPTLHRHFRGKVVNEPLPGLCPVLSPSFEEMLVKHIKEMQRLLFGLTLKEV